MAASQQAPSRRWLSVLCAMVGVSGATAVDTLRVGLLSGAGGSIDSVTDHATLQLRSDATAQSLVEVHTGEDPAYIATKRFGGGTYGDIYLGSPYAQRDTMDGFDFAIKFGKQSDGDHDAASEIPHEIEVMDATSECPNVLHRVVTPPADVVLCHAPQEASSLKAQLLCPDGYPITRPAGGGLVMKIMRGDLGRWVHDNTKEEAIRCRENIVRGIRQGLACMHATGWVHMDVKMNNVLYDDKDMDEDNCPVPHLTDFGISQRVGEMASLLFGSQMLLSGAVHMDPSRFVYIEENRVKVTPQLDDYSVHYVEACGFGVGKDCALMQADRQRTSAEKAAPYEALLARMRQREQDERQARQQAAPKKKKKKWSLIRALTSCVSGGCA